MIFQHLCNGCDSSQRSESLLSCAKRINFVPIAYYSFIRRGKLLNYTAAESSFRNPDIKFFKYVNSLCMESYSIQDNLSQWKFYSQPISVLSIIVRPRKPRKFDALTLCDFNDFVNSRAIDGSIQIETNPFNDRPALIGKSPA